jgi:hypothetical protein
MELESDNQCVYGLGECPVLVIMGGKMKALEQRSKVLPAEPGAAAMSQMMQPFIQLTSNIYSQLPAFCPSCPKRIVAIEKELGDIRQKRKSSAVPD